MFPVLICNIYIFTAYNGKDIWGMINNHITPWLSSAPTCSRTSGAGVISCLEVSDQRFPQNHGEGSSSHRSKETGLAVCEEQPASTSGRIVEEKREEGWEGRKIEGAFPPCLRALTLTKLIVFVFYAVEWVSSLKQHKYIAVFMGSGVQHVLAGSSLCLSWGKGQGRLCFCLEDQSSFSCLYNFFPCNCRPGCHCLGMTLGSERLPQPLFTRPPPKPPTAGSHSSPSDVPGSALQTLQGSSA